MNAKESLELSKRNKEAIKVKYIEKVKNAVYYNIGQECFVGKTNVDINFLAIPCGYNSVGVDYTGVKGLEDGKYIIDIVKKALEADSYTLRNIRGIYELNISWEN